MRKTLPAAFGLLLLAALGTASATAQRQGVEMDRVARRVFRPQLVLAHQKEIGLTADQRRSLVEEMQRTQADLVPLQVEMGEAGAELSALLDAPRVEEAAALRLTERVLALEGSVKRRHMMMLLRIKNLLSEEQQRRLHRLRRTDRRPGD